jgi:hypothetical protein
MTEVLALDVATCTGWARGPVGSAAPHCGETARCLNYKWDLMLRRLDR